MDRKGNRIIFNDAEQSMFAVAADVSIDSARATATMFNQVSRSLSSRGDLLCDKTDKEIVATGNRLKMRAVTLGTFALHIERLCAPEIDADFLQQLGGTA